MERDQLKKKLSESKTLLRKLLTVTKAINNNRKSGKLFALLDKILSEDLQIERYLFVRKEGNLWVKALSRKLEEEELRTEYFESLLK